MFASTIPQKIKKKWNYLTFPADMTTLESFESELGLPPLLGNLLFHYGYTTLNDANDFLTPQLSKLHSPFLMLGMQEAVDLALQILKNQEKVVILGDYDVDGISATAMLLEFFKSASFSNIDYFIPNRMEHGYGLTQVSVDLLIKMKPKLVITVDNGITSVEEVSRLNREGIETIITDHHLAAEEVPAGIVVNPNQPQCHYPFKGISGCGVAFKLMMALRKTLREQGWWSANRPEPNLKQFLDFAALGTIADVVPLVSENRILVTHGLSVLNQTPRVGIQAMTRIKGVLKITSSTVGFLIGPLLNAAGRLQHASIGVEILITSDSQKAWRLAQQLDTVNQERRSTENYMKCVALEKIRSSENHSAIIVSSPEFHEGINGIVASRLVDQFYKPTLVFTEKENLLKGSGRSIPEFHMKHALDACASLLGKYGGHAMAGGCTLPAENFSEFAKVFEAFCATHLPKDLSPQITIIGSLNLNQLTDRFVETLFLLQPFGEQNPSPLFEVDCPQDSFMILKEKHVKWNISSNIEIIGWNLVEEFADTLPNKLAVTLDFNEFRGNRKIQLTIKDYR